ncbi:carbohydrate ABC transporter permease [Saccharibacillus sp. CPCC 101409]|uniref:carbohydrate ABC transporter permease n=1 Tax=Saccharibacillus sp. CPCC 101409 TaxID=3058041 RepID=UPI002673AA15|nr:carbohydrate ABC transporter permease [Saccharibacillus sp. CPCC 101409]MDO3411921.1 carbohydrate ABC transporter permease [Saccharibacillus sp. CPCC 101409]
MTLIVTFAGTVVSVSITALFAYGISQNHIPGMKVVNFLMIFTMLFNGGLVATYYMYVHYLDFKDTIWALLIPNLLMNAFNVILVKNYMSYSIPGALKEAATIDGASEFKIFARIIMPLSLPIIATIGLMTGLAYWNDWQNGLYYLSGRDGASLYTIQIILNNINENIQVLLQNASQAQAIGANVAELPSTTIRMAIATIGILPILVLYPFFQRYFVKGITLGGVKE